MTCIVGLIHKNNIYMGADSAGVSENGLELRKDSKIFHNGEFLIGFTTSFRMGQLLRYKFTPPEISEIPLEKYMVTSFVDALRVCFKNSGYTKKSEDCEAGGTFLIGVRGRLFLISDDFQIGESINDYNACGCGGDIAKGALFALQNNPLLSSEEKITMALFAAERHCTGVRGPFNIEKLLTK